MGIQVSPLASLCLGVVRGWINVAKKGKGGQIDDKGTAWTRLPADQLRDQLAKEYMVDTSTRSIHRALKELGDAGLLRREQKWKHRYRRDYWYAIPSYEEELESYLPRSISNNHQSQRSRQKERHEVTVASNQVLIPPVYKHNSLRTDCGKNQRQERKKNLFHQAVKSCINKGIRPKPNGFDNTQKVPKTESSPPLIPEPIPLGIDHAGRPIKQVVVGGVTHKVVD